MTDIQLASRYLAKVESAKARGIRFSLSLKKFKQLMLIKRCQMSGVIFTEPQGKGGHLLQTDRTVDRIDSDRGYEDDNVMVVCHGVNNFKSRFECDPERIVVTVKVGLKILNLMLANDKKKPKVGASIPPVLIEIPTLKV